MRFLERMFNVLRTSRPTGRLASLACQLDPQKGDQRLQTAESLPASLTENLLHGEPP
jgi:hypothetical protein